MTTKTEETLWRDVVAATDAIANAAHGDKPIHQQAAIMLAAKLTEAVKAYGLQREPTP